MIIPNTSIPNHMYNQFAKLAESEGLSINQMVRKMIRELVLNSGGTEYADVAASTSQAKHLLRLHLKPGATEADLLRLLREAREAGLAPGTGVTTAAFGRKDYGQEAVHVRLTEEDMGTIRALSQGREMRVTAAILSRYPTFEAYLSDMALQGDVK